MDNADYKIHIESFEGPMDLLMHLIEKNKIDIYDIPIAKVTEQYLAYLEAMREFDIEVASEFLVMAATLLLIKSRMMLPKEKHEDEKNEDDPREELLSRIIEYQRYKKISAVMADIAEAQSRHVGREPMDIPIKHLPPENLSYDLLAEAFKNVMAVHEELAIPEEIVAHEEFRVEDQMVGIMRLLDERGGKLPFDMMFEKKSRSECIAAFLALLELVHKKAIRVRQAMIFSPIFIEVRSDAEEEGIDDGAE